MINLIGCLTALIIGLLLSNVESIGSRETKILTTISWLTALYYIYLKGGL